jgi:hypothetical protein
MICTLCATRIGGSLFLVLLLGSAMSGCRSMTPPKQALDTAAISAVQSEIKRQVGIYARVSREKIPQDPIQFACGNGNVDFDISTVKAELTVTTARTSKTGLSLEVPWNGVTISSTGQRTRGATNTQVLTYTLWLADSNLQAFAKENAEVSKEEVLDAPIAQVLLSLREALLNGAKKSGRGPEPCFTNYDPAKPAMDAGNSFKLGLAYDSGRTGGLEIKIGIIDLTSSTEWKSSTGNTLTITFVQRGLAAVQRARDAVDTECKYPKTEADKACKDALDALKEQRKKAGGTLIPG